MATEPTIAGYYDRLGRWTRIAHALGYRAGRDALSVHRALRDPRAPHRATSARLHDILLEHLPPMTSPRVLDAGCGFGGTMLYLAERIGGTYIGLTLSPSQASVARKAAQRAGLADRIEIRVESYDHPPAGTFDLIVAIESLAHSEAPEISIAALVRALAPGGLIVIVDDMPEIDALGSEDFARFTSGWQCPALSTAAQYRDAFRRLELQLLVDRDLTSEVRPRTLAAIARLEMLNHVLSRVIPIGGWRRVMESHAGGLALERLYRHELMRYRLFIGRGK